MKKSNREIFDYFECVFKNDISNYMNEFYISHSYSYVSILYGNISGTMLYTNSNDYTSISVMIDQNNFSNSKVDILCMNNRIEITSLRLSEDEKFQYSLSYPEIDFDILDELRELYIVITNKLAENEGTKYKHDIDYFKSLHEYLSTL